MNEIKLSNEPVEIVERKPLLGKGVHQVEIVDYDLTASKSGTPQITVQAENEYGETRSFWYLSPKALPYTINRLKAIILTNKETDEEKAKVIEYFEKVNSQQALWDTIQKAVIGKGLELKCWAKIYTEEYDGRVIYRTDISAYKPEVDEVVQVEEMADEPLTKEELDEFPF